MINFLEIMQAPVVSTSLVTPRDMIMVESSDVSNANPVVAYPYDEGAFVHINCDDECQLEQLEEYGYSENFVKLYEACIVQRMQFLRLDCDGSDVIGL